MSRSLFEFGDKKIQPEPKAENQNFQQRTQQSANNQAGNSNPPNQKEMQDMMNKYSKMPRNDLMKNLFQEVQRQKQNGTFDIKKLEKTIDGLGSFLTPEQKKNIKELLNQVK